VSGAGSACRANIGGNELWAARLGYPRPDNPAVRLVAMQWGPS